MSDTSFPGWHGTTIIGVRKGGEVVIAAQYRHGLPLPARRTRAPRRTRNSAAPRAAPGRCRR